MPKGRILAVDDQRYFRELLEGLLTEEGYEVQTCTSAEEALRLLDRAVFDVIVTDLVMPAMNGSELVQRVKERDPEQEIVVVTGVVDVESAVAAMKLGATDYLIKPFDRATLASALARILQRSGLRRERDTLLAENLAYLGERSLFERALGLFQAASLEALSERLLDALCQETGAQGGVLWWVAEGGVAGFGLTAAQGLVRPGEERARLTEAGLPEALRREGATTALASWTDPQGHSRPALWVGLRRAGALAGVCRLTDKLGGEAFDDLDRASAEKLVGYADTAYRNAERVLELERQTLQDPTTGAYRIEYLRDVARNEIEKANRFGRSFGLLQVVAEPLEPLRQRLDEPGFRRWHTTLGRYLGRQLRATDLLAVDGDGRFLMLLAESDAIGAATFKQRTRQALEQGEPLAAIQAELRPELSLGCVTYPGDATQLESLLRVLEARVAQDRRGHRRAQQLDGLPLPDALAALTDAAPDAPVETAASLLRFAIGEVGRRPRERGMVFCHPGAAFQGALAEGLCLRRDASGPMDLIVLGEPSAAGESAPGVTWVAPGALRDAPPFAVQFGDGPAYVWVSGDGTDADSARLFHSDERALAESLAFRLQSELRVPRIGP